METNVGSHIREMLIDIKYMHYIVYTVYADVAKKIYLHFKKEKK